MARTYIIGDIHGCFDELRDLLDKAGPTKDDHVISVGDLLDKGPKQAECVKFFRENHFSAVMGNHDYRHVRWRDREIARMTEGRLNHMRPLKEKDLLAHNQLDYADIEWLRQRPWFLQIPVDIGLPWLVVHGGFVPNVDPMEQTNSDVMYVKYVDEKGKKIQENYDDPSTLGVYSEGARHWTATWSYPYHVAYGHSAASLTEPLVANPPGAGSCWGVDTGAVHGGHLTALVLPDRKIVQVQAREKYDEPPVYIPWELPERLNT